MAYTPNTNVYSTPTTVASAVAAAELADDIEEAATYQPLPVASGSAVLVSGTVTVSNTSVTANAIIELLYSTRGGTPGAVYVAAITASTSFVITSTSETDTSTVKYRIMSY
jgi:hypothetical protein